eukprot:1403021-Rhodomonas_salina.4
MRTPIPKVHTCQSERRKLEISTEQLAASVSTMGEFAWNSSERSAMVSGGTTHDPSFSCAELFADAEV